MKEKLLCVLLSFGREFWMTPSNQRLKHLGTDPCRGLAGRGSTLKVKAIFLNDSKFSDRHVWTNGVDPDQTALEGWYLRCLALHCLPFQLYCFYNKNLGWRNNYTNLDLSFVLFRLFILLWIHIMKAKRNTTLSLTSNLWKTAEYIFSQIFHHMKAQSSLTVHDTCIIDMTYNYFKFQMLPKSGRS